MRAGEILKRGGAPRSESKSSMIALDVTFHVFGLNINDFADMKEGDIREVFLNIEN